MARIIRMPREAELPDGTVRDFARVLFTLYQEAHRPALRAISEAIRRSDSLRGTASPETIRRMLRGTSVPANWATVEAVFLTLCDIAELAPNTPLTDKEVERPIFRHVEDAWHRALDLPDWHYAKPLPPSEDPWADDPPF